MSHPIEMLESMRFDNPTLWHLQLLILIHFELAEKAARHRNHRLAILESHIFSILFLFCFYFVYQKENI